MSLMMILSCHPGSGCEPGPGLDEWPSPGLGETEPCSAAAALVSSAGAVVATFVSFISRGKRSAAAGSSSLREGWNHESVLNNQKHHPERVRGSHSRPLFTPGRREPRRRR